MKTSLLLAAILAAALLASVAWSGNLLPDPSFEEGKWELTAWDHGKGLHQFASPGRTGDKCVHLTGIEAKPAGINELAISPVLKIKPDTEYLFTIWYKTTPGLSPSVSFLTYTAPFATAGWSTPRAQYDTPALPAAPEWKLGILRLRTAPRTVEMRLALRLGAVGEVWFDDAALVCLDDYLLTTRVAGDFTAMPDQRVYEAAVKVPGREAWTLAVQGPGGAALGEVTGQGAQASVKVAFRAPDGAACRAELRQGGALVGSDEFTAPPPAELVVSTGRYRRQLYASAMPDAVRGEIRFHLTPALRPGLSYRAELRPAGVPIMYSQWAPVTEDSVTLAFSPDRLKPGEWQVLTEVRFGRELRKVRKSLTILPCDHPHEVVIDDYNNLWVSGRPFYPNGFYGAPDNDAQTRPIAQAGYNMVLTYMTDPAACRKWLDMCERLGLMGMVSVPRPFVDKFDEAKLREALAAVKDHPALLGWYLFDEPSPYEPNQRPEDLKRVYDVIAAEDPYHPVAVCICEASHETLYLDTYDVLMIDVYPVTHNPSPLTSVADRMDHAWAAVGGRKPVWNIPQTFGWDVIAGVDRQAWVTPTPAQIRVMYYLAVTHNAKALVAYCYHVYTRYDAEAAKAGKWAYVLGGYLPDQQARLWGELEKLGPELKALAPALAQPRQETRVLQDGKVHVGWFYGAGQAWVVAINADDKQTSNVDLPLPAGLGKPLQARDLALGGQVELVRSRVRLSLPPQAAAAAQLTF